MCNFISWIEYKNEILFLTKHELQTNKGKKLRKHLGSQFYSDIKGHGAIEHYYDLKPNIGVHKECEDFSSPDNFPLVIQEAIKAGDFEGIGIAEELLTSSSYADYKGGIQPAHADYEKISDAVYADYLKTRDAAFADYLNISDAVCADYKKIIDAVCADYKKISNAACTDYKKISDAAFADYLKISNAAHADYLKIIQPVFWKLFKIKSNRQKAWR